MYRPKVIKQPEVLTSNCFIGASVLTLIVVRDLHCQKEEINWAFMYRQVLQHFWVFNMGEQPSLNDKKYSYNSTVAWLCYLFEINSLW